MNNTVLSIITAFLLFVSCNHKNLDTPAQSDWKQELNSEIPLLGHRNWILVVDKAFPLQNAEGIVYIDTEEPLLEVLSYTLEQVQGASHVKPIIYTDKELGYMTTDLVPGIEKFKETLRGITGESDIQVLLHDSVFVKIDEASKLFKAVVLKTNGTIPYSSVFLELDCKYWSAGKEAQLRELMVSDD
ncbi:MAG: hypothetical protein GY790_19485 [Bacteroidetes bacterium]|nr:hypothetical protein [Bacteroidota bacterium]